MTCDSLNIPKDDQQGLEMNVKKHLGNCKWKPWGEDGGGAGRGRCREAICRGSQ